ncbi:MAG: ATP-binding protein [Puniceicoccaceae bacterium]|nr:MAG: ATP-binding protein [Puniceicoccaceae bacterium]
MIQRQKKLGAIDAGFSRAPIVSITGLRQCGKTTLARAYAADQNGPVHYFDLEDPRSLARLREPMLALETLEGLIVIDEVQRLPPLFPILRVLADRPEGKARFLLLGSASPVLLDSISESLAGRVALLEIDGFDLLETGPDHWRQLWLRGGLPPSYLASADDDSLLWRQDFITLFLERDLPQLGITIPSTTLRRFWLMLAHFHGGIWNAAELARSLGASEPTARRYLDILTGAFSVRQLPAWFENVGKRTVKSPKIYLRDPGLLHALLEIRNWEQLESHPKLGASWEGFCLEQILHHCDPRQAYFWATHAGAELDLLLFSGGKRIGVEIKYTDTPGTTRSMRVALADLKLDHLFVVHPGKQRHPLAPRIEALPLGDLLESLPNCGT